MPKGVACGECLLRCSDAFRPLSPEELAFVAKSKSRHLRRPANATLYVPGQRDVPLYTVYSGWAFRYARFADGSRQIVEFLLPGDLVGLPAIFLARMTYGAEALTAVELCEHRGGPLDGLFADHPGLSRSLVQGLVEDRKRADLRLAVLGQRQGPHRVAYLMLELYDRLARLGVAGDGTCEMPLRRRHWADATGMSGTHVARSLAHLRDRGLAVVEGGVLTILDREGLAALSGYMAFDDPGPRLLL